MFKVYSQFKMPFKCCRKRGEDSQDDGRSQQLGLKRSSGPEAVGLFPKSTIDEHTSQ